MFRLNNILNLHKRGFSKVNDKAQYFNLEICVDGNEDSVLCIDRAKSQTVGCMHQVLIDSREQFIRTDFIAFSFKKCDNHNVTF
jgi:hypothetical protein